MYASASQWENQLPAAIPSRITKTRESQRIKPHLLSLGQFEPGDKHMYSKYEVLYYTYVTLSKKILQKNEDGEQKFEMGLTAWTWQGAIEHG